MRPKAKPRKCVVCGDNFQPPGSDITCSPECRRVRTNAKHKDWRDANPEKWNGWGRRWRTNNPERQRELIRNWNARQKEKRA